jgi:phosphatidylglycerol:prolipoprotein diacylglycerol transferase
MPWGVTFTNPHALIPPELMGIALHPTQLYESAGNLLLFILLHFAYKRPHKDGAILVTYIFAYSLMRFVIEFFRGDFRGNFLFGMSPSQCISLGAAAVALVIWLKFLRTKKHHA